MTASELFSNLANSEPSTALAEWQFLGHSPQVISRSDLSRNGDMPEAHGATEAEPFKLERDSTIRVEVAEDEESKATLAIKPGTIAALVQECIQSFGALEHGVRTPFAVIEL
ncbi:hypothetical protein AC579_2702 [Pseudocercospora musae]|uniref:Uncharacterized protein n=1 Tax=Pseudocercospora musae TaxID=113226 RepID=A0A139IVH1_9PEZI|nr:hypothetical protein AC579_2702 [Pseudocercospora musae]